MKTNAALAWVAPEGCDRCHWRGFRYIETGYISSHTGEVEVSSVDEEECSCQVSPEDAFSE